ncbi:preATP grasp domain-containing protein [Actinacidiphila yeochonensis]|uniref:preATP grasp domain-containing protein n=1 Tax=Actinacidiphila yeochonensis TaxID=89050 RepID=UPI00068DBCD3|nr:ATP-grasp domain-containing protein [Actinacidiphila yeochonensis]
MPSFPRAVKQALVGDPDAVFVLLGNFEVEDVWGQGEPGLPRMSFSSGNSIAHRMDEFALLVGCAGDHVVTKSAPDADYLAYLADLGVDLPTVHNPAEQEPGRTVTRDVLADPALLERLRALAAEGAYLAVHGWSELEEELARRTGLRPAGSPAAVCKAVNSKVYSRRLADRLGLRQPAGFACATIEEWGQAVEGATRLLAAGERVGVKDAYGVSGKGIVVVEDQRRLEQLDRAVRRRAERDGDDRAGLLVEQWVAKRCDLNYQFTVGRDGGVRFDFVKEALTVDGVHKGHRMPARISAAQEEAVREAARSIGTALAADGYAGVVGVDAMVGADEGLFPLVEINARNNMSTYQVPLQELAVPEGWTALARQYPLRLTAPLAFKDLRRAMAGLLLERPGQAGMVVNNFATVNAAASAATGRGYEGRLHGFLAAPTPEEADALDARVIAVLADLTGTQAPGTASGATPEDPAK